MPEGNESILKKEFKESDVNRIRNIVTKKYNNATTVQFGYKKIEKEHKEGDVWEENGKEWTIKDGIKQSHTRLDELKKAMMMPLLCPECGHQMRTVYDKKMYPLHKKCFSCVVSMETTMKVNGTYQEYVDNIVKGNMKGFVKDAREFISDFVNESDDTYNEQGDKQDFLGGFNRKELAEKWNNKLNQFEKNLNTDENIDAIV